MFRFPWGDMHSLNLGWFLQKFNELREDWATAEAGIDGALDAEIQRAEDALSDVFDARDAAAASATAAAGSASAAGTSATAAQNSATGAASSATLANQKATAAGLSEAAAAQSATQAGNSASAAAGSATAASNAATNAAASETAATTEALKSEGYAVGKQNGTDVASGSPYYHNNSKYYAESIAGDASAAATSATNAAASASAAQQSAAEAAASAASAASNALTPHDIITAFFANKLFKNTITVAGKTIDINGFMVNAAKTGSGSGYLHVSLFGEPAYVTGAFNESFFATLYNGGNYAAFPAGVSYPASARYMLRTYVRNIKSYITFGTIDPSTNEITTISGGSTVTASSNFLAPVEVDLTTFFQTCATNGNIMAVYRYEAASAQTETGGLYAEVYGTTGSAQARTDEMHKEEERKE